MPTKIRDNESFDHMESLVLFTRAALRLSPLTEPFIPETDEWLRLIDEGRREERAFSEHFANTWARRLFAKVHVSNTFKGFVKELTFRSIQKLHPSQRVFFNGTPSKWMRQSFSKKHEDIKGWLSLAAHSIFDNHREKFSESYDMLTRSIYDASRLRQLRNDLQEHRAAISRTLTKQRDRMHRALGELADTHNLPRNWPNRFFPNSTSSSLKELLESPEASS